jgi:hypothetical protein
MSTDTKLPPDGYLLNSLEYLSEARAALAVDVTPQTFISYRKAGKGPKFTQIGRGFFYQIDSLKEWLAAGGTAAPANTASTTPVTRTAKKARAR